MGSVELGHGGGLGHGAGQVHDVLLDHGVLQDHGVQLHHGEQLDGGLGWGALVPGWTQTTEGGEPAQKKIIFRSSDFTLVSSDKTIIN